MIEDDFYRTSSQYRLWSYTESSLRTLRATTNAVASDRVRAALRRTREAHHSTTSSATGTPQPGSENAGSIPDENKIECLTPEEELVFVRYYCEQTLELGDTYSPPLPTMVRVSLTRGIVREDNLLFNEVLIVPSGYCHSVLAPLLLDQLAHDLSPEVDHGMCALPRDQNRQLLHVPQSIRTRYPG